MIRRILLCLTAVILLAGCKIHEVPGGGDADHNALVELTLSLKFQKDLPAYQDVVPIVKVAENYRVRYVIALYRSPDGEKAEGKPVYVFAFDDDAMADREYTVGVSPDIYRVAAWVDFVSDSKAFYTSPAFEDADDDAHFTEVSIITDPYEGITALRDAFYGVSGCDLTVYHTNTAQHSLVIPMKRPNAQFRFVATDKEEFYKYWTSKGGFDLSGFSVKIGYPQFLPSTFSVFEEKPIDAVSGVSFFSDIVEKQDGTVDLGSDWVFANADQTSVVVSLTFYDAAGKFISTIPSIVIPLCQGKVTTVRGALLTNGVDSGISIDPGFDGDIVVNI